MPIAKLNRSVIRLSGENLTSWLDGLITNKLSDDITFAALLTPQGKIIADFFIVKSGENLLIDTPEKFAGTLSKRLTMYKLRAKIEIAETGLSVYAAWNGEGDEGLADPRHTDLGRRIVAEHLETTHSPEDYDAHRLSLGIPDSAWDFDSAEMFPANVNMDLINGVDFKKGCFVGQEVVSRMKRKTTVRKRALGFSYNGTISERTITAGKRQVGEILHVNNGRGIALMRLDRLAETDDAPMIGDIKIDLMESDYGDPA